MLDEKFIESLPSDPLLALNAVVVHSIAFWDGLSGGKEQNEYEFFLESFAISKALIGNIPEIVIEEPVLDCEVADVVANIHNYFHLVKSTIAEHLVLLKLAQFNSKYQAKFSNAFAYEFTDGDLERIQNLITELRESISSSDVFEENHKLRLLARLEKMQSEMHKKMADLDRFWGLVGDAGVVLGKFGNDVKPIVNRIKEISEIVWRTQSRAEELPSDTPMELLSNMADED